MSFRPLPVDGTFLCGPVSVLPVAEARGGLPRRPCIFTHHRPIQLHLHRKANEKISGYYTGDILKIYQCKICQDTTPNVDQL